MWTGSKRHYKEKPFGVKWPDEPIKALGVYFTYDQKLLKEKNVIERLDSVKKLINIWSARDLSIHGEVTIIKFFLSFFSLSTFTFVPSFQLPRNC